MLGSRFGSNDRAQTGTSGGCCLAKRDDGRIEGVYRQAPLSPGYRTYSTDWGTERKTHPRPRLTGKSTLLGNGHRQARETVATPQTQGNSPRSSESIWFAKHPKSLTFLDIFGRAPRRREMKAYGLDPVKGSCTLIRVHGTILHHMPASEAGRHRPAPRRNRQAGGAAYQCQQHKIWSRGVANTSSAVRTPESLWAAMKTL